MRELLGGKGANVAEMTRVLGPDRVPAGFTITTEACVAYMEADRAFPEGLEEQVAEALERLEEQAGKSLGDADDPLLVSVRSGARESMPGMMDTVLNLGLNDESVEGLGGDRFAWDSYRRFVQMFGNVCRGIPGERYEDLITEVGRDLDAEGLKALTARFKQVFADETGEEFPQDPQEQLKQAIRAVFDSWMGDRAVSYRRINHIPDDWGTAVNVQQMVFGNRGDRSCSGVAFSRDEITGEPTPSGDFLVNAQGEDVVSGVRTPRDIHEMKEVMPEAYDELMEILRTLEAHYLDMQDTEFTVEEGSLYMLQTRNAKRPAQAGVRFAVDAVEEGLLDKPAAIATIDAGKLDALLHPAFARDADFDVLAKGVAASPGAAKGEIVFTAAEAVAAAEAGRARDPGAAVHGGRRRGRLPRRAGHPDRGGRQGLARRAGRARDGQAVRVGRRGARDRPQREDPQGGGHAARRGRHDRDRRLGRGSDGGRRAARGAGGVGPLPDGAGLGRRGAHPRCTSERRHARGRGQGARVRRSGHRPLPHRAHVHGGGPPAEDAGDDHGRRGGRPPQGAGRAAPASAGGLRGPVRPDERPAGDDPPARPAAARVPALGRGRGAGGRACPHRGVGRPAGVRAPARPHSFAGRGQPDAGHARRPPRRAAPRGLRDAGARDRARGTRGGGPARGRDHDPARRLREGARADARAGRARDRGGGRRRRRPADRDDDRAPASVLRRRPDRRAGRLLLVRHQRPHPDGARLLARRRRGPFPDALHRAQGARPQPVRDDRQAGSGLARPAGGVGGPRGARGPQAGRLRRARRRPRLDRLLPAGRPRLRELLARTACRSPGSRRPRRR